MVLDILKRPLQESCPINKQKSNISEIPFKNIKVRIKIRRQQIVLKTIIGSFSVHANYHLKPKSRETFRFILFAKSRPFEL
jgi:hypothetical protein